VCGFVVRFRIVSPHPPQLRFFLVLLRLLFIVVLVLFPLVFNIQCSQWFDDVVPFFIVEPSCDPDRFKELNQLVDQRQAMVDEFASARDLFLVQTRRYAIDVLTYADAWVGCAQFCKNLLRAERKVTMFQNSRLVCA
jgi:hypothetical protein